MSPTAAHPDRPRFTTARQAHDAWAVEPDHDRSAILKTITWCLNHLESDVKRNLENMKAQIVMMIGRRDAMEEGAARDRQTALIAEFQKRRAEYEAETAGDYRKCLEEQYGLLAAHDAGRVLVMAAE